MIRAEEIHVDSDEDGFSLEVGFIGPNDGEEHLRINVQAVAEDLYAEVDKWIGAWLDEGLGRTRRPDSSAAIVEAAGRFATRDPGVEWPDGPHDDPVDAVMAALDREREMAATLTSRVAAVTAGDVQPHETKAAAFMDRADDWANRDMSGGDEDWRRKIVGYNLRLAQVHATLAVAQQLSMIGGKA